MNKILDLRQIINTLQKQKTFRICLFHQKTNYNIPFRFLYLNYCDLPQINYILKEITYPPFQIKVNTNLDNEYRFNQQQKMLYIKKSFENSFFELTQRLRHQVFGDL